MNPLSPSSLWHLSRTLHQTGRRRRAKFVKLLNFRIHRAILPPEAIVRGTVSLGHYATNIVIHPNVEMGNRVHIWHGVTIAARTYVGSPHKIYIGDDVEIGTGAVIISPIDSDLRIGSGAKIGANAVVVRDVDDGATVVGVPARDLR